MKLRKSTDPPEALAEEAKGNYAQAAALYAQAGAFEKVGEMYELLGDLTRDMPEKIKAYQQAIHWYKQPEHLEPAAAKIAVVMEAEIRADNAISPSERYRLADVAEYYARAKQWEKAGKIYEELHLDDQATEMYIQGGAIEQIERLASLKKSRVHQQVTAQQLYTDGQAFLKVGMRDKAQHALQQCLQLDEHHADARALLSTFSQGLLPLETRRIHIPSEDREYVLFAKSVITIGRKEDNDIVVMNQDVSRSHARVGLKNQAFLVEDHGSSNGTRLNGLRIQKTAVLHDRDMLGIGLHQQFEVFLQQRPSGMSALLRPVPEQENRKQRYLIFSGDLLIGADCECDLALQTLMAPALPYLFKLAYKAPYWSLAIHPHALNVELNGVAVSDYVVVIAGDALVVNGVSILFE